MMCDETKNECCNHADPPWEGPQVIPAQIRRVDNLIFRKINQFARENDVEQATPMHGWIIGYLYRHRDTPVFQRDIEREFSITRSTVTNILQLMERKGYIERRSVPQGRPAQAAGAHRRGHLLPRKDDALLPPDRRLCGWAADSGGKYRAAAAFKQAAGSAAVMQKGGVPVAFSSDTNRAIPSPALLPFGQQGPTPADGLRRNSRPTAPERCIYPVQSTEKVFVKLVIMNIF